MKIAYSGKNIFYWTIVALLVLSCLSTSRASAQQQNEDEDDDETGAQRALEDLRDILKHRKTLGYIKSMLDTLYNDFNDMHKRACLVGGGMFHGCDYKDILEGTQDQNHYAFRAPGRKRRSSPSSSSSSATSSSSSSAQLLKSLFQKRRK
ncbi:Uncharacterised protein g3630 [Pycnogonum litorale]